MEHNIEDDKVMKNMFENSMMEITDPAFNSSIMKKILVEDRKRFIIRSISLYFLIFISICVAVFLIVRSAFATATPGLFRAIVGNIGLAGIWLSENMQFIIPFIILIAVKKMMTARFKQA